MPAVSLYGVEMTFEHEHTVTTSASPEAVWALWSDVGSWHRWDATVERVALEGHFAEGAAGTLCLADGQEAPFAIELVEPRRRFLDRLHLAGLVIRTDHEVSPADPGAAVTVRVAVEGATADRVGPLVAEDTTASLAALVAMAEGPTE